jgi:hypothetical protein
MRGAVEISQKSNLGDAVPNTGVAGGPGVCVCVWGGGSHRPTPHSAEHPPSQLACIRQGVIQDRKAQPTRRWSNCIWDMQYCDTGCRIWMGLPAVGSW